MKKFIFVIMILYAILPLVAQDIIIFRNGEEKETIVKKVGMNSIEYLRYDNQRGALYEVAKDEVFMIKYQNGTKDVFEQKTTSEEANKRVEGTFVDERDSEVYRWVKISEQVWMGENLRYDNGSSPCCQDERVDCNTCGRYYNYEDALESCPKGWHLPSDMEWIELEIYAGMTEAEAIKDGWRGSGKGQASQLLLEGETGLELRMCGTTWRSNFSNKNPKYKSGGTFSEGYYWTSTRANKYASNTDPFYRYFKNRLSIYRGTIEDFNRYSVRCIKDASN